MYRWGHRMAVISTNVWKDGGGPKIMTNGHHTLVWQMWGLRCTHLEPQVIYFFFLFCYLLTTCNSMKQCWCQYLTSTSAFTVKLGVSSQGIFFLLLSFFLLYWLLFTISMDWETTITRQMFSQTIGWAPNYSWPTHCPVWDVIFGVHNNENVFQPQLAIYRHPY